MKTTIIARKENIEKNTKTISTLEVAEMMEVEHWKILRKLDGQEKDGKHIKGYIEILGDNEIVVTDYFIKSTYLSSQNKEMPCYKVTKMGCEFLANKFTGEKGVIFTAKFVKRFHEMEEIIREGQEFIGNSEKQSYIPKVPLVSDWYERNKGRMERLCAKCGKNRKYMYHCILQRLSEKYDLDQAREFYKSEVGYYPIYAIDIVCYFPELGEEADKYLDRIEKAVYNL